MEERRDSIPGDRARGPVDDSELKHDPMDERRHHKYKKECFFSCPCGYNSTTPCVVAELKIFSQYRAPTLYGLP